MLDQNARSEPNLPTNLMSRRRGRVLLGALGRLNSVHFCLVEHSVRGRNHIKDIQGLPKNIVINIGRELPDNPWDNWFLKAEKMHLEITLAYPYSLWSPLLP